MRQSHRFTDCLQVWSAVHKFESRHVQAALPAFRLPCSGCMQAALLQLPLGALDKLEARPAPIIPLSSMDDLELEWDSDSNSTASDLSGPGRNFDNMLGFWGRRLERLVNGADRPPRPPLPPAPHLSQISFITNSDQATVPDNPGPGYTINKALARGGAPLERAITWLARRARRGPTGSMADIMKALRTELERRCPPTFCEDRACRFRYTPAPPSPPPAHDLPPVYHWILAIRDDSRGFLSPCPQCGHEQRSGPYHWTGLALPRKQCKKLVRLLR